MEKPRFNYPKPEIVGRNLNGLSRINRKVLFFDLNRRTPTLGPGIGEALGRFEGLSSTDDLQNQDV